MKKIDNRGVLLTLGLTFLTLIVLALAILIFHTAQKYEEIVTLLAVIDRVYDLDNSIQQSSRDIFNLKAGILINITNGSVSFEEKLPNNNITRFNTSINQLKRFIESNISNVNLTLVNMSELSLWVEPKNIAYKHQGEGNAIIVMPEQVNFNGYSIFINTNRNVSCGWNVNSGSLDFSLEVKGDAIDCEPRTEKINPSVENEILVNSMEEGGMIAIKIWDNGRLFINLTKNIPVTVRTTLLINQPRIEVIANSIILDIDFSEFGIYKENRIRVK